MRYNTILKGVEKPGRYIGGEWGQTLMIKDKVKARIAFLLSRYIRNRDVQSRRENFIWSIE